MAKEKNYEGWKDLQTLQTREMLSALTECKESHRSALLIAETGLGKSHAIKLFMRTKPRHTYLVTVGHTYRLRDIVDELGGMLGIERIFSKNFLHLKILLIINRLAQIKEESNPLIIIDEAENLSRSAMKTVKQLYDAVIDYCSIVMIGTPDIVVEMRKRYNGQSIPQLWRRFKAGTRYISSLEKARDFRPFFDLYIPDNTDVQDLLLNHCENYGELHDYLHPVMEHCDKKKIQLTEELFRFYHKLPKNILIHKIKRA